ncbi:Uncharacterised protein [uncultured archaeon]|nr:Uncharacterised protein [uncultured archaeon]
MDRREVDSLFRRLEIASWTRDMVRVPRRRGGFPRFKDRFQTGKVFLPELKLQVSLKPDQMYRLEEADDLFSREVEIQETYLGHVDVRHADRYSLKGLFIPMRNPELTHGCSLNFVLVKKGLREPTQTYVVGHENGHFLFNVGLRDSVYREYGVSRQTQEEIKDTEDFAMFCGNLAMANAGYKLPRIRSVYANPVLLEKENRARQLAIDTLPDQFYFQMFGGST